MLSDVMKELLRQPIFILQCYFRPFKVRMWKGNYEVKDMRERKRIISSEKQEIS